jgi:hypothetical protein
VWYIAWLWPTTAARPTQVIPGLYTCCVFMLCLVLHYAVHTILQSMVACNNQLPAMAFPSCCLVKHQLHLVVFGNLQLGVLQLGTLCLTSACRPHSYRAAMHDNVGYAGATSGLNKLVGGLLARGICCHGMAGAANGQLLWTYSPAWLCRRFPPGSRRHPPAGNQDAGVCH